MDKEIDDIVITEADFPIGDERKKNGKSLTTNETQNSSIMDYVDELMNPYDDYDVEPYMTNYKEESPKTIEDIYSTYYNRDEARKFIKVLLNGNKDYKLEIRKIKSYYADSKAVKRFFVTVDNIEEALDFVEEDKYKSMKYISINPIDRKTEIPHGIKDKTIIDYEGYHWFAIDIDPVYRKDKDGKKIRENATEEESLECQKTADKIIDFLNLERNNYILTYSGNGMFLLIKINKNKDVSRIKNCLLEIKNLFDSELVEIDRSVYNPSRICKIAGTINAKNKTLPGREARVCRLINIPSVDAVNSINISDIENKLPTPKTIFDNIAKNSNIESENKAGWEIIKESIGNRIPTRTIPDRLFMDCNKLSRGETCPICGESNNQCLHGTSLQGDEWSLCWNSNKFNSIEGEGTKWLRIHTFGEHGSCFMWADGTDVFKKDTAEEETVFILPMGETNKRKKIQIKHYIKQIPKNSFFHYYMRYIGHFRKLTTSDAPNVISAIYLIDYLRHNSFKNNIGYPISPWVMFISPSGTGKSLIFSEADKIGEDIYMSCYEEKIKSKGIPLTFQQMTKESFTAHKKQDHFIWYLDEFKNIRTKQSQSMLDFVMSSKTGSATTTIAKNNRKRKQEDGEAEGIEEDMKDRKERGYEFSFFASSTFESFIKNISEEDLKNGFVNRMILVSDEVDRIEIKKRKVGLCFRPNKIKELYGEKISRDFIIEIGKKFVERVQKISKYVLSAESAEYQFEQSLKEGNCYLEEFNYENLRMDDSVHELAALIECSKIIDDEYYYKHFDNDGTKTELIIHLDSMKIACDFVFYETRKVFSKIFKGLSKNDDEDDLNKVTNFVERHFEKDDEYIKTFYFKGNKIRGLEKHIIFNRLKHSIKIPSKRRKAISNFLDNLDYVEIKAYRKKDETGKSISIIVKCEL